MLGVVSKRLALTEEGPLEIRMSPKPASGSEPQSRTLAERLKGPAPRSMFQTEGEYEEHLGYWRSRYGRHPAGGSAASTTE